MVLAAPGRCPEELARECQAAGGQALAVLTDMTDEAAVAELARRAVERFGRIDVWVNNAGVYLLGSLEATPPEAFRRVLEVNGPSACGELRMLGGDAHLGVATGDLGAERHRSPP